MNRLAKELGPPLAGVAGLLVVWAIVAAFVAPSTVPSPAEGWSAFTRGGSDGTIPDAAAKAFPPAPPPSVGGAPTAPPLPRVAPARRGVVRSLRARGRVRGDRRCV